MNEQKIHWLLRKKTIRHLWIGFIVVLAITLLAGIFVHQHESFGIEDSFGFFAWYGFITCVAMVIFAKLLGIFLKRPENYYDDPPNSPINSSGAKHD